MYVVIVDFFYGIALKQHNGKIEHGETRRQDNESRNIISPLDIIKRFFITELLIKPISNYLGAN